MPPSQRTRTLSRIDKPLDHDQCQAETTEPSRSPSSWWRVALAIVGASVLTLSQMGAAPALAVGTTPRPATQTITFLPIDTCKQVYCLSHLKVPDGVHFIDVVADGSAGNPGHNGGDDQNSGVGGASGAGGRVTGTVTVVPGDELTVFVGSRGTNKPISSLWCGDKDHPRDSAGSAPFGAPFPGGAGGGGDFCAGGANGGDGGAASAVWLNGGPLSNGLPTVVAAGGGGGGGGGAAGGIIIGYGGGDGGPGGAYSNGGGGDGQTGAGEEDRGGVGGTGSQHGTYTDSTGQCAGGGDCTNVGYGSSGGGGGGGGFITPGNGGGGGTYGYGGGGGAGGMSFAAPGLLFGTFGASPLGADAVGQVTLTYRTPISQTFASATPSSASARQRIEFSAVVQSYSGYSQPTGRVTFTVDGFHLCRGRLHPMKGFTDRAEANCTTNHTPVGNQTVTATYPGDRTFLPSSSTVQVSVTP